MASKVISCKANRRSSDGGSGGSARSKRQGDKRLLIACIGATLLSLLLELLTLGEQGDGRLLVTNTSIMPPVIIFFLIAAVITRILCAIIDEDFGKVFPVVCFLLIVLTIGFAIKSSEKATDPGLPQSALQPAATHSTEPDSSSPTPTPSEGSPAATFSTFYEAWKNNDAPGVKAILSKNYLDEVTVLAAKHNMAMDDVLGMFLRGFPLPSDAPPQTRNEVIRFYVATLEAWNERANRWVSVPFVKENNQWKLAMEQAVRDASMNGILICTPTRAQSHIHPRHWLVLQPWLAGKGRLRIATTNDFLNKSRLTEMEKREGKSFHPYYLVRDFDGDRKEDFAVVLIDESQFDARFAIVVFNGPFSFKSRVPAFFKDGFDLSGERFFLTDDNRLGFGRYAGVGEYFYLEPGAKGYTLKNSADDPKLEAERSSEQAVGNDQKHAPKSDKQNL